MYAAAPVVWSDNGALYRDVPYVQAPLTIFLNYGLMKLFSAGDVFVASRYLSMVFVFSAALLCAFAMRHTKDREFIFLFIVTFLTNSYILSNSAEMGSYAQPLFLLAAAFAASTLRLKPSARAGLVGLALGLSVAAKLNFLLAFPAFLLLLLLQVEQSWRVVAWFGLGAFVGMAPLLYYAMADFGDFYRRLVQFHYLTLEARGLDPVKSASQILTALADLAKTMAAPAGLLATRLLVRPKEERNRETLLVLTFLGCGLAMGIAARTVYVQYLAPLVMFLLFFSAPDRKFSPEAKRVVWIVGVTFFLIQQFALLIETTQRVLGEKGLAMRHVIQMQRQAALTADALKKCDRRLYSSQPLFLLSDAVKYPAELGAGPFLLALRGGKLKAEDVGVDMDARLKSWAPNLVIYGFYSGRGDSFAAVDDKIETYAKEHGFEMKELGSVTNRRVVIAYDKACV